MQKILLPIFVVLALALGVVISVLGIKIAALILVALVPLPIILRDYRAGVVLLAFLLPIAFVLPPVKGLNIINLLTGFTLCAFFLRKGFSLREVTWPPKVLFICFVVPAGVGILLALPHTYEIARNYPIPAEMLGMVEPRKYAIDKFIKPIFHYVGFAFLLANAIKDSRSPERFVALFGLTSVAPAMIVLWTAATYPGSLAQLVGDREFMRNVGMHANEFGMSLALAAGPLLFVGGTAADKTLRWLCRLLFGLVTLSLIMTFSRGGFLAYTVVLIGYLVSRRQFKTILAFGVIVLFSLLLAPDVVKERFGGGLRPGALLDATGSDVSKDELTAGRVRGWLLLAPEVLKSPLYGSGIGSTQWSAAVASKRYVATHPHNIYLEILMDLGVIGLTLMFYLHVVYLRRLNRLSKSGELSPTLSAFFAGSRWSLWGILAMAATHGFYMPSPAQSLLWYSLGFMFAYWSVANESGVKRYLGRSFGAPPTKLRPNEATRTGSITRT
jgi:O-antigen ligase